MKHKLLSLLFATMVAMNMFATDVWDGSSDIFTHGAGTEQSPYLIENAEQLAFIAEMVNAGIYTYSGNYFKLTTDLDLNNIPWTPIGTETYPFQGNFNGDEHFISNLLVTSTTRAGLFGVVDGCTCTGLTVSGSVTCTNNSMYGHEAVTFISDIIGYGGGIVGYAQNNSQITNCTNLAHVEGGATCGGVVGGVDNSIVRNCLNRGYITAQKVSGGIAGECLNNAELENLYNYADISVVGFTSKKSHQKEVLQNANYTYKANHHVTLFARGISGGIIGMVTNNAQLNNCYNYGKISADISQSPYDDIKYNYYTSWMGEKTQYHYEYYKYTFEAYSMFGGIVGYFQKGSMINCYNSGIGIGDCNAGVTASYRVSDSMNSNYVSQMNFDRHLYGGGLVGDAWNLSISHCFNTGIHDNSQGQLIGGNINLGNTSDSKSINITYSYDVREYISSSYTTNLANYKNTYIVFADNKGYYNETKAFNSKTEAQMKSVSMPIFLNMDSTVFTTDIKPNVNKGYPIFKNNAKYVTTNATTKISYTSATLNGNYYNCTPLVMGFEYKEEGAENYLSQTVSNASPAQFELTNLTQGTTYVARYWLIDDGIKYYGDTIHFTTLACPTEPVRSDTVALCQGESYEFAGKALTQAGVYHDSLVATTGCDSVIELVLQVTDTYKYPRTETINRGESYDFYGQLLTEPGVYNEYIRTTNRCNWIELTLIVHELDKTLTLNVNNPLWGSVVGAGTFEHGTVAEFSAVPAEGCYFVNWSDGDTNAERAISLTKDTTITANFAIHQYTITTQATNGTITGGGTYNYGTQVNLTAVADEHYHFVRWSDGNTEATRQITVTENKTYSAVFELDNFLVTFRNADGTELKSEEVEYGVMPVAPADPTKESTAQYDYTFAGWTPTITIVTQAATYTATYTSTIREYLVTFLNEDNTVISSKNYKYGETPIAPADPVKQNTAEYTYSFNGWDNAIAQVQGPQTYKATYTATKNSYTITWQNEDGSLIDQTTVEYGQIPAHANPVKQNTAEYTYTFAGWTPAVVAVTGNATYKATFTAAKNSYTITWQDENGSLIDQTTVEYGVVPAHTDPVKQNTAEYTYTFAGWTPTVVAVTCNATYRATFSATKNKYLITFRNDDGTVLKSEEVEYGMLPIAPATPTKESTAQYNYEFAGWTPSVTLVSQAATYTATYNASVREYLVTFLNDDNSIISMQSCKYGSYPTIPSTPTKQATAEYTYTFAGWTPAVVAVTSDATYKATFTATKNSYTITWQNEDGSLIDQTTVEYGVVPTHADPVKENTAEYTYTFTGWTPEVVAVTGNATYRATFNAKKNSYTITWQNEDGSLIDQTTVEYGVVPTHADPVKENTAEYTYTFTGWTPAVVAVTGNATYRATFSSEVNMYSITTNVVNGEVEGVGVYLYGTEVTLTAIPNDGYAFDQWSDGVKDNPRTIIVLDDAEYIALFTSTEDIDNLVAPENVRKVIIDDKVYILRGDKTYTLTGQEVK